MTLTSGEPRGAAEPARLVDLDTRAFIGGEFVDALSGKSFPTYNPANGEQLAQIAECDQGDVDAAVQAARAAFESGVWSRMAPGERKRVLLRFADLLEANTERLAQLDCLEAGKPITDCREIDVPETIATFRWYAEYADKLYDSVAPTGPDALGLIVREPVGVVGAVLPWNFPALMLAWKCAPALAAGNSMMVKPAELTSLSALKIAELASEAGLPDGVLNVVPGDGPATGAALGMHMDVDVVSFTGSTEVGRLFLRYSAETNLKRVVLEMGGKSPQIVLEDAPDLDLVAEQVLDAAFWNMGENCSAGSVVQRPVHDELVAKVISGGAAWKVGNPQDPATKLGPLIEPAHFDKVMSYIDAGRDDGATLALGGSRVLAESGGYFLPATVFGGVENGMRIARDEIFGPVLSVIAFDREDEAVRLANDTSYGLAASLWTSNIDAAHRIGRAVKAEPFRSTATRKATSRPPSAAINNPDSVDATSPCTRSTNTSSSRRSGSPAGRNPRLRAPSDRRLAASGASPLSAGRWGQLTLPPPDDPTVRGGCYPDRPEPTGEPAADYIRYQFLSGRSAA